MSRKLIATVCLSIALTGAEITGLAAAEDPAWLVRYAASNTDGNSAIPVPQSQLFAIQRDIAAGTQQAGAAAALDLYFDTDDGFAASPAQGGYPAAFASPSGTGITASLGGAVGFQFGEVSAGPFSSLTYSRSFSDGRAEPGRLDTAEEALTGSFGLQTSARFGTGAGAVDSHIRLSLDHDFDIDDGTIGQAAGSARRSIYMEELDATKFDLENAISLRIKGRVPGLFFYETKIRVRMTGISEVNGRIKIKF